VIRLAVDALAPDATAIAAAADVLHWGGIVAYPTDTLYGLAVDPRSERAVRRLFEVKDRDTRAAVTLIAADLVQAQEAGAFGASELALARAFWPGPLTIVVPVRAALTPSLTGELTTVGVRVPGHAAARALAAEFGWCITATSANRSGQPPASTADEAAAALHGRIDALIDAGPAPGGPPSTIVEFADGRPVMRRSGAIAWDRVLESLQ
jgi:L-threonylcarbamoyladenylate synthase